VCLEIEIGRVLKLINWRKTVTLFGAVFFARLVIARVNAYIGKQQLQQQSAFRWYMKNNKRTVKNAKTKIIFQAVLMVRHDIIIILVPILTSVAAAVKIT